MSHVTDVRLRVSDLACVEEALVASFPQLELRRGKTSFHWYGVWMNDFHGQNAAVTKGRDPKTFGQCEHAIVLKDDPTAYEIGLVQAADGLGWDLLYDSWDGRIESICGEDLGKLRQELAYTAAVRKAKQTLGRKGWTTSREKLADGRVRLKLRKR